MPLDLPAKPAQPQVKWIHLTPETLKVVNPVLLDLGLEPMEPGELLNYENFQTLAVWIIEERGYVNQLENLLATEKELQP